MWDQTGEKTNEEISGILSISYSVSGGRLEILVWNCPSFCFILIQRGEVESFDLVELS